MKFRHPEISLGLIVVHRDGQDEHESRIIGLRSRNATARLQASRWFFGLFSSRPADRGWRPGLGPRCRRRGFGARPHHARPTTLRGPGRTSCTQVPPHGDQDHLGGEPEPGRTQSGRIKTGPRRRRRPVPRDCRTQRANRQCNRPSPTRLTAGDRLRGWPT